MCKFCESDTGIEKLDALQFSLGIAGNMEVEIYMHSVPKNDYIDAHKWEPIPTLSVGVGPVQGDFFTSKQIPIAYCPFCGRKVTAEK